MWQQIVMFYTVILLLTITITAGQRVAPGVPPQQYQGPNQHAPMHGQHPQQPPQYQQQQIHVAPGVAPQQYQQQYQQAPVQQHQQQHYQQPQAQQVHQGQPQQLQQQQQQQQVPQQHQQVPQQQQQGHHQGGHHAPHGHHGQQVLHTGNIQDERAHIQEHLQVPIDTSKMSESELQFHYFKMHDSDNNNKLDGCELIKSLIHWHVEGEDNKDKGKDPAGSENGAEHNDNKKDAAASENNDTGADKKNATVYTDDGLIEIIDYVLKTMDMNNDGYVDYVEYLTKNVEVDNA